jgi:hypothetical protein
VSQVTRISGLREKVNIQSKKRSSATVIGEVADMAEIIRETVTTQSTVPHSSEDSRFNHQATDSLTIEYLIYFLFGILEILLIFRTVFKLLGASTNSPFVRMIYSFTSLFIFPFEGIFRRGVTQGIETAAVLEPATLVAIAVYGVVAWGLVKLIQILSGEKQTT